jgi:hypothetical protein
MTFIRKQGNEYLICHRPAFRINRSARTATGRYVDSDYRDWWFIKTGNGRCGILPLGNVVTPNSFVGKKVKIKVIILDDDLTELKDD